MQILISCAKDMSTREDVLKTEDLSKEEMDSWPATVPHYWKEAVEAATEMSGMPVETLAKLLGCNEKLAALNRERFGKFKTATIPDAALPDGSHPEFMQAAMTYNGVAFKHLHASSLAREEKIQANGKLWIASFLYGLLRPMDLMLPYRMEGKVKLQVHGNRNMFDWWKKELTDRLLESVREDDGILLWCSTEEMKRLVEWPRLLAGVKVIEPEFLVRKGQALKSMSVFAKMCRGAMARHFIQAQTARQSPKDGQPSRGSKPSKDSQLPTGRQSPITLEALKAFTYEGFAFEGERRDADGHRVLTFIAEK